MKNLRRLIVLFLSHWPTALFAFAAMLLVAAGTAALISLVGGLFDSLAGGHGALAGGTKTASSGIGIARYLDEIRQAAQGWLEVRLPREGMAVPLLIVFCLLVKNLGQYAGDYLINRIGLLVVRDLRQQLYDSILGRSVRFFSERATGELTSRVMADIERIQASLGGRFGDLLQDSLTSAVLFIYVVSLDRRLALFTFLLTPAILLPILRLTRRLRKTATQSQQRVAILSEVLQETIRGHRIVKAFGMERFESERFRTANVSYFRTLLREARIQAISTPLMETVAGIGMAGIFVFAQHEISRGRASLGTFVSFVTGLAALYAPVKRLNKGNMALQQALAASERVFAVLDLPLDVADAAEAKTLPPFEREIVFENVSFEYRDREQVLRGIDLTVTRGEIVAFVGASGAGKSTLIQLVPRFYDVTGGRILIDGQDLRGVSQASLRSQIGLVTQDIFLFNDTVRNNIAYGRIDLPIERVREAARMAYADDFISALPEQYETVVGEAGVRLSGGQKQRIAIARALLKDPPLLILDEATSALDVESERMVQQALENLMKKRTTLVVAHRLSTIRRADRIVVLEAGKAVEVGNHDSLLAAGGVYARLYRLHSFDQTAAANEAPDAKGLEEEAK